MDEPATTSQPLNVLLGIKTFLENAIGTATSNRYQVESVILRDCHVPDRIISLDELIQYSETSCQDNCHDSSPSPTIQSEPQGNTRLPPPGTLVKNDPAEFAACSSPSSVSEVVIQPQGIDDETRISSIYCQVGESQYQESDSFEDQHTCVLCPGQPHFDSMLSLLSHLSQEHDGASVGSFTENSAVKGEKQEDESDDNSENITSDSCSPLKSTRSYLKREMPSSAVRRSKRSRQLPAKLRDKDVLKCSNASVTCEAIQAPPGEDSESDPAAESSPLHDLSFDGDEEISRTSKPTSKNVKQKKHTSNLQGQTLANEQLTTEVEWRLSGRKQTEVGNLEEIEVAPSVPASQGYLNMEEYRCFLCTKDSVVYKDQDCLCAHVLETHTTFHSRDKTTPLITCRHCNSVFKCKILNRKLGLYMVYRALSSVLQHMHHAHQIALPSYVKPYWCPEKGCNFFAVMKKSIDMHLTSHEKKVPCPHCKKMYKATSLHIHLRKSASCRDPSKKISSKWCDIENKISLQFPAKVHDHEGMPICSEASLTIEAIQAPPGEHSESEPAAESSSLHDQSFESDAEMSMISEQGPKYTKQRRNTLKSQIKIRDTRLKPRGLSHKKTSNKLKAKVTKDSDVPSIPTHLRYLNMEEHRCFLCEEDTILYESQDFLSAHVLREHTTRAAHDEQIPVIHCASCSTIFKCKTLNRNLGLYMVYRALGSLLQHMHHIHQIPLPKYVTPYQCSQQGCDFFAVMKKSVDLHAASHGKKSPCPHCGKLFHALYLDRHIERKVCLEGTPNRLEYHCKDCGRPFVSKTGVERHQRTTHAGILDYTCHICSMRTDDKRVLNGHLFRKHRINAENRAVISCSICGYENIYKNIVEKHVQKHGEKQLFHCDLCSKVLSSKSNLQTHMYFCHTEKTRRFPCNFCNFVAKTKGGLKEHSTAQHIHSDMHRCSIDGCKYTTGYIGNLNKHQARCHPHKAKGRNRTKNKKSTCIAVAVVECSSLKGKFSRDNEVSKTSDDFSNSLPDPSVTDQEKHPQVDPESEKIQDQSDLEQTSSTLDETELNVTDEVEGGVVAVGTTDQADIPDFQHFLKQQQQNMYELCQPQQ